MVALWKRMSEYFGQSWVREYGEPDGEPIKAWGDGLAQYSEAQIARGVKSCQEWRGNFPPTLPQFRELCLTVRAEEIKAWKPEVPILEHLKPHAVSPVARREMARMHALMAGRSEFEFEGQTYRMQTPEECYHALGLGALWGNLKGAAF